MSADTPAARQAAILRAVLRIPAGQTRSYGDVARMAGLPGRARLVGRVLSELGQQNHVPQEFAALPWHRVVNAQGRLSVVGSVADEQRARLRSEGVLVTRSGAVAKAFRPGDDGEEALGMLLDDAPLKLDEDGG